jgi:hypothetical protein
VSCNSCVSNLLANSGLGGERKEGEDFYTIYHPALPSISQLPIHHDINSIKTAKSSFCSTASTSATSVQV